jgi:hypothetical protein
VSRRDSDVDYYESLDEPPVRPDACCRDCGDLYVQVAGDPLCDVCADARDAHADALETRWKETA